MITGIQEFKVAKEFPKPLPLEKNSLYEMVMNETISDSKGGNPVNLDGFREFSLLARFEGPANATFAFEIYFDNITVVRENIELNAGGWINFAKIYPVYAPKVGLAVYHPPTNLKVRISFYAGR
jgi:hypothetical protein